MMNAVGGMGDKRLLVQHAIASLIAFTVTGDNYFWFYVDLGRVGFLERENFSKINGSSFEILVTHNPFKSTYNIKY